MSDKPLPTSAYVVLGLIARNKGATAYSIKKAVAEAIANFWQIGHPQVYALARKLTSEGYIKETVETSGRHRRMYQLTDKGRKAFNAWMEDSDRFTSEYRHEGVLKLYFADGFSDETVIELAKSQAEAHSARIKEYETLKKGIKRGVYAMKTLEIGLDLERLAKKTWINLVKELETASQPTP